MKKVVIGRPGATYLLVLMLMTKVFTPEPRMLSVKVGTSAWLVVLLAGIVALGGYWFLYALLRRFPGQSLGQISRGVLGPVAGPAFCLLYSLYFLYLSGIFLRLFILEFGVTILPKTPPSVLTLLFAATACFVAYKGLENLSRMASYLFPVLLSLFLLTIAGTLEHLDFRQLFPLFGNGLATTLLMPFPESSLYSEILALGVMAAALQGKDLGRTGHSAMLWAIVGLTLTWIVLGAAFPYPAISRLAFPFFDLTRAIKIGDFVQRIEALFVFLYVFVAGLKLAMTLYASATFFGEAAGIRRHRPLLLPMALLAFTISFMPRGQLLAATLDSVTLRIWSWPFSYALPAITLAVAALRGVRGQ